MSLLPGPCSERSWKIHVHVLLNLSAYIDNHEFTSKLPCSMSAFILVFPFQYLQLLSPIVRSLPPITLDAFSHWHKQSPILLRTPFSPPLVLRVLVSPYMDVLLTISGSDTSAQLPLCGDTFSLIQGLWTELFRKRRGRERGTDLSLNAEF